MDLNAIMLLGMDLGEWITAGVLLAIICGLIYGQIGADLVLLSGLVVLLLTGVVDVHEAVRGFANPAVLTIGFLYIVSAGLRQTGALTLITSKLLGRPRSLLAAQARLTIPVAIGSAFVNNTPIVTMFLPVLSGWAKRNNLCASRLFMPLSFAAILGGTCTLIGTSTNLVVNEMIHEQIASDQIAATQLTTDNAETSATTLKPFGMFTLTWVGLPVTIAGLAYLLIAGRRLLPDQDQRKLQLHDPREYMIPMCVEPGSPIIGKNVEDAGLRQLPGLFLSRIDRRSESIIAVTPAQLIREKDILVFVGVLESIVDLQQIKGLAPMTGAAGKQHTVPRHSARLIEAVISNASPLLGVSIREGAFRTRYDAVVIAVHRSGERLRGKIGDIRLRAGDTLLLEATPEFAERFRDSQDFYLVSELPGQAAPRHKLAGVAVGVLAMMVTLITIWPEQVMTFALLSALLMILTRCCTGPQARASVDWQVLIVIGSSFGIGQAMHASGLASLIADGLINWAGDYGLWSLLGMIYVITAIFTSVVTNNAAAVLVFPIALETARANELPFMPFAVCVAVAASAGFATPLGYQTNLMVMGPGGYRTIDFLRFGAPLTLLTGLVCVAIAPLVFGGG